MSASTAQTSTMNELRTSGSFVLKICVAVTAAVTILLSNTLLRKPRAHMFCIATSAPLTISLIFVALYVRHKVPVFMEKMHLFFQICFTFGCFVEMVLLYLNVRRWWWTLYCILFVVIMLCSMADFMIIINNKGCTFSCS